MPRRCYLPFLTLLIPVLTGAAPAGNPPAGDQAELHKLQGYVSEVREQVGELQSALRKAEERNTRQSALIDQLDAMERSKIIEVLNDTRGNKLETARRLGIGRQTLYNKIKAYAINV